jgi:hypothetical protein
MRILLRRLLPAGGLVDRFWLVAHVALGRAGLTLAGLTLLSLAWLALFLALLVVLLFLGLSLLLVVVLLVRSHSRSSLGSLR